MRLTAHGIVGSTLGLRREPGAEGCVESQRPARRTLRGR
jgi:hypothetical protein